MRCHLSFFIMLIGILVSSCGMSPEGSWTTSVSKWNGKIIKFPLESSFTLFADKVVPSPKKANSRYTILSYIDSKGCISCKTKFKEWKDFILYLDDMSSNLVSVLFYAAPMDYDEFKYILKREDFNYPICIDKEDSLNKLNSLPDDMDLQTFLLDKDNKVLAIGNPVLNPKVKDLYLRIIRGESPQAPSDAGTPVTTVSVSSTEADLGTFPWQEPQTCTFTLRNTGDRPLVIHDVSAGEQKSLTKPDRYPLRRRRKGFLAKCQTLSDKKCGDFGGKFITLRCATAGVLPQPAGRGCRPYRCGKTFINLI